jgi:hypothetical protein
LRKGRSVPAQIEEQLAGVGSGAGEDEQQVAAANRGDDGHAIPVFQNSGAQRLALGGLPEAMGALHERGCERGHGVRIECLTGSVINGKTVGAQNDYRIHSIAGCQPLYYVSQHGHENLELDGDKTVSST